MRAIFSNKMISNLPFPFLFFQKISPNDIMDKSMFVYDQREVVLDTIRKILPQFQPTYTAPKITYTNPLLLNLNDNVRPVEENLNRTVRLFGILASIDQYINKFSTICLFRVNLLMALKFLIPKKVLLVQISRAFSRNK